MLRNELYFYTATIKDWKPLLAEHNFEPVIINSLQYLCDKGCINVYGFVIMPNHVHLIWELLENNGKESPVASFMKFTAHEFERRLRKSAPAALRDFAVTQTDRRYLFWQPHADWFRLYKRETIWQKLQYIHLNPMRGKWSLVNDPAAYPYSSCGFYETGVSPFPFLSHMDDWKEVPV